MIQEGNVTVRLAIPDDVPQLADLRWRLQTDDEEAFDPDERKRFVSQFANSILLRFIDESLFHWIAESDGRVVAVMSVGKVLKVPSPKSIIRHWGYLTNCYTLPDYRNKGIGTRLLMAIKDWAHIQKCEFLAVWPSDRSFPFYERVGFQRYADPLILKIDDED